MKHPESIYKIMWNENEYDYDEIKQFTFNELERYYNDAGKTYDDNTTRMAINTFIYNESYIFEEYGVEKAATMIAAMLFSIKHDDVDHDVACETYNDLIDLKSGDYDDLFENKDDLKKIKEDMNAIFDYIDKHPQLIE